MNHRSVEEYLKLPYTIEIIRDPNEANPGWVARVVELPGCFTQSDNFEELEAMLEDAMRGWLEIAIEDGLPIPEPREVQNFSGKFIVRVPKSLHRQLVEQAELEGISLNQYVSTILAKAVGAAEARATPIPPQMVYPPKNMDLILAEKQSISLLREEKKDYQTTDDLNQGD